MGDYWLTTLTAIQRGEPDWRAIAAYETPVRRFLHQRFGNLPAAERDDLLQEILLAMRERIVGSYDPDRGRFRSFLRTAIRNAAHDHLRRRRVRAAQPADDHDLPDPPPELDLSDHELDSIDLEAELVRAIRDVHDRYASGPQRDRARLYCLSGVLVHGRSNRQIAKHEGLSPDQVKRHLQALRAEITQALLARLLPDASPPDLAHAADTLRACLRTPRKASRLLDDHPHSDTLAEVIARIRDARSFLSAEPDLVRGIQAVFTD